MASKGSKQTTAAVVAAEDAVARFAPLGALRFKPMFGGCGIFEGETMFALTTPDGDLYLRVDDGNRAAYEAAGSPRHGRMPYFRVPEDVLTDDAATHRWAEAALTAARNAKR